MSEETWDIAPPPFDAGQALLTFKRWLRDQRVLAERGEGWCLGADLVLKLAPDGEALKLHLARRPARTPEWEVFTLRSALDTRKLQDEIKRRLTRWKDDE